MPTQKKVFTVDNLTEKLKQAKALILADYSGLKVSQINELRAEIKKAGGEFEVIKNTLLSLAAKNAQSSQPKAGRPLAEKSNFQIEGPTVALWIYEEDITPLKNLYTFIKKNELPKLKLGFWNGEQITVDKIKQLANLPSLEQLRANLVGQLKSPLYRLHQDLNWNIQKLVLILKSASGRTRGGEK